MFYIVVFENHLFFTLRWRLPYSEATSMVEISIGQIWVSRLVINMNNVPVINYSYPDSAHFPNLELLVTSFCNSIYISLFICIYANPHHLLFISMGIFLWDLEYALICHTYPYVVFKVWICTSRYAYPL